MFKDTCVVDTEGVCVPCGRACCTWEGEVRDMLWDSVYVGVVGKVMSRERKSGRLLWALGVVVLVLILSVGHTFGFCVCQYGESFVPLPSNHAAGLTSRTNCPASWMCSTFKIFLGSEILCVQ